MPLTPLPDCHLVRTAILCPPRVFEKSQPGQPRCFPPQSNRLLASFAGNISRGNRIFCHVHDKNAWLPYPHLPTQGRLRCTQHLAFARKRILFHRSRSHTHRNAGSRLFRTGLAPHKNRSPRKQGRVPHAIGDRPELASTRAAEVAPQTVPTVLPPSTHPKLGVQSKHKGFQRCAL